MAINSQDQNQPDPQLSQLLLSEHQLSVLELIGFRLQSALMQLRFSQTEHDQSNIRQHVHLTSKLEMLREIMQYDALLHQEAILREQAALSNPNDNDNR